MKAVLDLDRYPLDDLTGQGAGQRGDALVQTCRRELADRGMFSLAGFVRRQALEACVGEVQPVLDGAAFIHRRNHNIFFDDDVSEVPADHPALSRVETIHQTVCADQIPDSLVCRIYAWPPLVEFLSATMGKDQLYPMADPLARANVIAYRRGEALNWHFDRAEFTTTLILQSPRAGGEFQYRGGLRSEHATDYDGVARLLADADDEVCTLPLAAGTLNVFKGKHTAHRVTPVEGPLQRIIAVFSYFEVPGVQFSAAERLGFYGRTGAVG